MLRQIIALLVVVIASAPAAACPFCGGEARSRLTLRLQFAQAKVVVQGQLKNPRFDPKTDEGSTELHVVTVLKDNPARGGQGLVMLRTYLPVVGSTPTEFIAFCGVIDGKLDPAFGVPSTPALLEYLKVAVMLDDRDAAAKLAFYFRHLDSPDARIAEDAFYEFARASDAEIAKAAKQFDPIKIRKLLADPATPLERLGVFAFLLGVSGGPTDAPFLGAMLSEKPLSERTTAAFSGLLAGYLLLNPKDGWPYAAALLGDARQSFTIRLSTIGAVRFFQASRSADSKNDVLRCYAALLPCGDLADQAIEDLRRWGYWELTTEVLTQFSKPTHQAPIVRNSIVRYALTCQDESCKRFIAAIRQTDPKLVQSVEDSLRELYGPRK